VTDKQLLAWMLFGGFLEYLGAQAQSISYSGALAAGMNGGIVGALIALNTVFVLIAAYFMFNETLGRIKFLAMIILVGACCLVSLFRPDN
jgi:drug/metabolite transporter (DMT)-like permease